MKKTCLIFMSVLFFNLVNYGQTTPVQKSGNLQHEKTLEEKLEGTYVLIKKHPEVKMMISMETLRKIESKRDASKDIFLYINEDLTIKILPRSVINAPDFDPKKYQ